MAEATNSQKPISPRDLKSNSPEMMRLASMLKDNNIYLEVKRGVKKTKGFKPKYSIRNDELAQIILSMVVQTPGTAKTSVKRIFESQRIYNSIFKVNYERDANKKAFLIDIIQLYSRYQIIADELKKKGLTSEQVSILKNGKEVIFALIGVIYRLANNDLSEDELRSDKSIVRNKDFLYGSFLSNYHGDDLDMKLKHIISDIVVVVTDSYRGAYFDGVTTSVNYYCKSDSQYMSRILNAFINVLPTITFGTEIKSMMDIFKRA